MTDATPLGSEQSNSHPQHATDGSDWQQSDERDRLAEKWLIDQHSPEWYIGDATDAEWEAAYAAVDHWPSRGDGINADHFIGG